MRSALALSALGAAALGSASSVPKYSSSLNMTIDPNTVSATDRGTWCNGQTDTCLLLCDQSVAEMQCMVDTLNYTCLCSSNNSEPGLQYYQQTMPTYICDRLFKNCEDTNAGDSDALGDCKTNIKDLCGTIPPPDAKANTGASTTATGGSTSTATSAQTSKATSKAAKGSGSGSGATSTSSGFAAPTMAPAARGVGAAAFAAIGAVAYFV